MKTYKQKEVDLIISRVKNIKNTFLKDIDIQLEKLQNLQPVEPEPEKKEWQQKPQYDSTYFVIGDDGEVRIAWWRNQQRDEKRYKAGNCFPCDTLDINLPYSISLQNQLNTMLTRYAVAHRALASKEERANEYKTLWWISGISPDMVSIDYSKVKYPLGAIFNDKAVVLQSIKDVVEPFLKEHQEFVW